MTISPLTKLALRIATGVTLAFMYIPLGIIALCAFNERRSLTWPIPGLTFRWFEKAIENPGVRDAVCTSLKAGLGATAVALVLGTLASIAVSRYRFFGRETVVPGHPPNRASGNRDRDGVERDIPDSPGAVRRRPGTLHDG